MIFLKSADSVIVELGERVRTLRLAQNVSQQELAERVSSSLSSVRRLESSGQSTVHLLVRVAQALQAEAALDSLFIASSTSIADLERNAHIQKRQRSRRAGKQAA